jgi:hypothetical protein
VIESARAVSEAARAAAVAPLSGIGAAAAEALRQFDSGQPLFEDFSFVGMSENLRAFNDALGDRFQAQGGGDVRAFLERLVASQQQVADAVTASPVQVRVFIGDTELTDFVTQIVAGQDRATAGRLRAGTGVTW